MSRNMRHHLIVGSIDSILVIKRHWQADDSRRRQLWVKSRSADHVAGRVHARLVAPNQRTSGPQADWCKNQEIRDKKKIKKSATRRGPIKRTCIAVIG
jgi:hypothetical protein